LANEARIAGLTNAPANMPAIGGFDGSDADAGDAPNAAAVEFSTFMNLLTC
jgi:hypothetical protein